MKSFSVVALFAALAGSADAFAPVSSSRASTSLKAQTYNPELEGMSGVTVETGNKVFDPLFLSNWVPPQFAREAEIANGRSAMLATVGWIWPATFGTFESNDVTTTDPIDAIMQADPQWWAQFVIFCAVIEGIKYRGKMQGKSYCGPGEPCIDWSNSYPADEAGRAKIHEQELKNGRLAMIGFAGFMAAHFIPGSVPIAP
uniref:Plastid light harvesting protein n=2 Tax=Ditylum brightwellii TaxID=49249 RepID=A0A6S9CRZ6_9STRA|mmetsp:Transcript_34445/g.46133  ORF Transcript_34445/g.46133 Transcript_34445/m.46133 type:complete len:200 (+) Transcript_34445:64-663(+)